MTQAPPLISAGACANRAQREKSGLLGRLRAQCNLYRDFLTIAEDIQRNGLAGLRISGQVRDQVFKPGHGLSINTGDDVAGGGGISICINRSRLKTRFFGWPARDKRRDQESPAARA